MNLYILYSIGEVESIGIKAQNMNPFLTHEQEAKENLRLGFINYSSDARLKEGHGRLFDQVLACMRFAVNVANGFPYYDGDFNDFFRLSRSDPRVAAMNSQIFTMYKVKPSTIGLNGMGFVEDSYTCENEDFSIFQNTIRAVLQVSPYEAYGKLTKYERDGPDGRLILRNFVRFMDSWDKERISGDFWIARIVATGTLCVQDLMYI